MTRLLRHLTPSRWTAVAVALVAVLTLPALSGGAPSTSSGLKAYFDGTDPQTPLDIYGVRFGQLSSTDLTLIIRTHKAWDASIINPVFGRSLCVALRADAEKFAAGRLCAYPSETAKTGLGLRYTVLDPSNGEQRGIRDLSTTVKRPNKSTFKVTLTPGLLRLKPGTYHWQARSQFRDDARCPPPDGCVDKLPNSGETEMNISVSVEPAARQRCFGAASRDFKRPCRNPKLKLAVVPTPDVAELSPNLPCTPLEQVGLVIPCQFGMPAEKSMSSVALIGDSHAAHWRAALEHVSQKVKWRGISITRSGCPFTRAVAQLEPKSRRDQCWQWNKQVPLWLRAHPSIKTVFVVAHYDAGVVTPAGRDAFAVKMAGYRAAWRKLPKSVKRVIVIRDTPKSTPDTLNCVRAAMAKRKSAANACALKRDDALDRDPATAAAAREGSRVRTIDMTRYFCSDERCYPVVGGALVYKDISHLTDVFASTLGPPLLRKIRALNDN